MLNKDIPTPALLALKLLVLDSDGVCIPRGTEIKQFWSPGVWEVRFKTKVISDELGDLINELRKKITVCISSGRSLIYLQTMYSKIIGENTILQAENGHLSLIGGELVQHVSCTEQYFKKIARIRRDVEGLLVCSFEPKQFILTIHSPGDDKRVRAIITKHDPEGELQVMWNGEAFDVQKKGCSKGQGLSSLERRLGISAGQVIAIGDRVNDKELVTQAGTGISADPEALPAEYWTTGDELPGRQLVEYLIKILP